MAQPNLTMLVVTPGQAAWDATVNTNYQTIRAWLEDGPLPLWNNTGEDPTAGAWDQSIYFQLVDATFWILKYSDGTVLKTVAWAETFVATLGQVISNPPTQAEVQALSDKVDELIAALRDGFALPAS